jgi:hypothetical protein
VQRTQSSEAEKKHATQGLHFNGSPLLKNLARSSILVWQLHKDSSSPTPCVCRGLPGLWQSGLSPPTYLVVTLQGSRSPVRWAILPRGQEQWLPTQIQTEACYQGDLICRSLPSIWGIGDP